jgi:hypothetical protein
MNNPLLIPFFLFSYNKSRAHFIYPKKEKKLKVDFSSKANNSNVRGVCTFSDTCSNVEHLFPYSFKDFGCNFLEIKISKIIPFLYYVGLFEIKFRTDVNYL